RRTRRLLGPIFGVACFLATLTGVVVLSVLLGSVSSAALRQPGDPAWHAVAARASELPARLWSLATKPQSSDPALAGFKAGIVGSLWLLGLVAAMAIPVGVG